MSVTLHDSHPDDVEGFDEGPAERVAPLHERRLVGAAMLEASILDEVHLNPADFHDVRLEQMWRVMLGLRGEQRPTDFVTVVTEYQRRGHLGVDNAAAASLTSMVPYASVVTAGHDAREVALAAAARRVVEINQRMTLAVMRGEDPSAVVDEARAALEEIPVAGADLGVDMVDAMDQGVDDATGPRMHRDTPWADLNRVLHGWKPGRVYIVGARPGDGKTMTGLVAAVHMAQEHGKDVAFQSLEVPAADLGQRATAARAHVDYFKLQSNQLHADHWIAATKARDDLDASKGRLFINDRSSLTPAKVRAHVRAVARRGNLGLVVVDYLGLMTDDSKHESRQAEVTAMSRAMKALARDLNVPVIILSQLSRAGASRGEDSKPRITDLRESGSLEQDADVVLLLHRNRDKEAAGVDVLYVNVAKNRQGPQDEIELHWQPRYQNVGDL